MIRRSQRRLERPQPGFDSALHRKISARKQWHARLLLASSVALSMSLVLWVIAAPFVWRLSLTLLGFGLGLLVPRARDERWAFSWIERSVGLSYQALIELDPNTDSYGFRPALEARAQRGLRRLELPQFQPWWLPLLFIALLLSLMPALTGGVSPLLPTGAPTPPSPENQLDPVTQPPDDPAADSPEEALQEDAHELVEEAELGLQEDAAPLLEGDASGAREALGSGERLTDEEAISRFLEQLQEQRAEERQMQQNPFSSLRPVTMDEDASTRREQTSSAAEVDADEQDGEPGETASSEAGDNEGEQTGVEVGAGAGDDGEQADESLSSDEREGDIPGDSSGAGDDMAADTPPDSELSPGGEDLGEQDAMEPSLEAGESQEGAGELGLSSPSDGGQEGEAESAGPPEALPGVIEEGPASIAGTIRLPEGDVPTIAFEQLPTEFRRADEQAITEGRIPLEYQEIIRNYFR
jgi:hypothetical protein